MIVGEVDENRIPRITVRVANQDWPAVIDTGFNGDLELPLALQPKVRAEFVGRLQSDLAGGQTIIEDTYLLEFPFDGRTFPAYATFSKGEGISSARVCCDIIACRSTSRPKRSCWNAPTENEIITSYS